MIIIRRVGACVLAIAAVLVWFLMAPDPVKTEGLQPLQDRSGDISSALSDYESNNALANSAPQQQVVNGWADKDLLTILAKEQNDANTRGIPAPPVAKPDNRVPALIGLAVLALALGVATTPGPLRPHGRVTTPPDSSQPPMPQPAVAGA